MSALKAYRLDCCKDGTITIRKRGQRSFNGAALPVYSTTTKAKAEYLQILTCSYRLPGIQDEARYVFSWGCVDNELEQMDRIAAVFAEIEKNGPARGRELAHKLNQQMRLLAKGGAQ